jgi:hypothetical protein
MHGAGRALVLTVGQPYYPMEMSPSRAGKSVASGPVMWPDLRGGVSVSDRERPLVTGVDGPLMARRSRPRIIVAEKAWSAVAWYAVVRMGML